MRSTPVEFHQANDVADVADDVIDAPEPVGVPRPTLKTAGNAAETSLFVGFRGVYQMIKSKSESLCSSKKYSLLYRS